MEKENSSVILMRPRVMMMGRHTTWENNGRRNISVPFAPAHALEASRAGAVTTAADQGLNPVRKAPPATTTSTHEDTIRELTLTSTAPLSASCL